MMIEAILAGLCIKYNIITATTTMYSKVETCPHNQCITASGREIGGTDKDVVACPRSIALGTKIIIGNKEYTCEDRTALRYDGRFDIWNGADYYGALEYGIQKRKIIILKYNNK